MSKERAKGTAFETAVAQYLNLSGFAVRRTGSADYGGGDIVGLDGYTIECKNHKEIKLADFVDQSVAAALRNGNNVPIAIVKRRNRGVQDAYVVMPLSAFTRTLR